MTTRRNKFKPDFKAKVALEALKGDFSKESALAMMLQLAFEAE